MTKALMLIDIQNDYFPGGKLELFNPNEALSNAKKTLALFRQKKYPVIHVQHINIKPDAKFFLPNSSGVNIHNELMPVKDEVVVIKHYPNSFFETKLLEVLKGEKINSLVICGMMSHMCVDTTVRAAKDYFLDVILLEDACCTKNLVFNGEIITADLVHKTFMAGLDGMFAKVIKTSEFINK